MHLANGTTLNHARFVAWPARLQWAAAGLFAGAFLGRAGGWFVWNFIYGIGSRVVSDELYAELLGDVCYWSAFGGGATGLLVGALLTKRLVLAIPAQQCLGVLAGMICANWGWQAGLTGYYIGQVLGMVVGAWLARSASRYDWLEPLH